jgi:YCII-related domain
MLAPSFPHITIKPFFGKYNHALHILALLKPSRFRQHDPRRLGERKRSLWCLYWRSKSGWRVRFNRLVETATTLSVENGQRRIQDGPFAATRETLGGYFVIEVPTLDAALAWAEKCPAAQYGKIEIRASAMGSL